MLLDLLTEGAADPWDVVVSPDGKMLWITLAGVHQLATIRLETLHRLLTGKEDPKEVLKDARSIPTAWIELALQEGRNRQVRRMTAAVGCPTLRLLRTAIGPWTVAGLEPGQWREIPRAEAEAALAAARTLRTPSRRLRSASRARAPARS